MVDDRKAVVLACTSWDVTQQVELGLYHTWHHTQKPKFHLLRHDMTSVTRRGLLPVAIQVWSRYEEPKEEPVQENEVLERKVSYKTVVITEVTGDMHFYAQNTENGQSGVVTLREFLEMSGNSANVIEESGKMAHSRVTVREFV